MPEHNTAASKKKAPSAGGGGKRSAGGQKLGRKAARAAVKSEEGVERLLALLEGEGRVAAHLTLGRVERVYGGGFYDVRLLDGTVGRLGLGGNIRGGRGGCFISLHDFVVVDGGALKGRLSAAEADRAKDAVTVARIRVKKGFFAAAVDGGELAAAEEDDLFDRSEERRTEEEERAARKAAAAAEAERIARLRVLLPGRKAVAPVAAEVLAPVRAASAAVAEEESDDEEDDEEAAPAATGAGGEVVRKPAPSGMNRAQRRAAAQAAAELEEARQAFLRSKAEDEEFQRQLATGDLGGAEWVDDDEVDVDAI